MEITKTSENKVSVYELIFDEEQIKNLRNEIIKNCSIRVNGRYRVEAHTHTDAKEIINSLVDSIGNKIYENVSDIREEQVNDPFDYWRHGDPVPYSFEADALVSPKLVGFLNKLLSDVEIVPFEYDNFKERKELSEKSKLHMKILLLDHEISQISNMDTERKIKKLKELALLIELFNDIPNFDYDKLSTYYDLAEQAINLELVQETIKYKRMK